MCLTDRPRKSRTPKPHRSNVETINSASRGHLNEKPRFDAPADKNAARGEISRFRQATRIRALPEGRQKQRRRPNIEAGRQQQISAAMPFEIREIRYGQLRFDPLDCQGRSNTLTQSEAMGDTAYGDGATRQAFVDAGRKLVARVPGRPNRKHFPKDDFVIGLVAGSCTCPAGQLTRVIVPAGKRTDGTGTFIVCGLSGLRRRCAGRARCGPSASRPKAGRAGKC